MFGQIVSVREKTLGNTNLIASKHILKRIENVSLAVDKKVAQNALLKLISVPFRCSRGKNVVIFCVLSCNIYHLCYKFA